MAQGDYLGGGGAGTSGTPLLPGLSPVTGTCPGKAEVEGDADEPGAEGGVTPEPGQPAQGAEEGLLGGVLRVLDAAQDAVADRHHAAPMWPQQLFQGSTVSAQRGPDEGGLGRWPI